MPSAKPRAMKVLSGTVQPCRDHGEHLPLPAADELPTAPSWLPNGHALREYERLGNALLALGLLHAGNVGVLAMLATVHGKLVQSLEAGTPLQASLVAQYRGLAADLKLTVLLRDPHVSMRENPFAKFGRLNAFANNGRRPEPTKGS